MPMPRILPAVLLLLLAPGPATRAEDKARAEAAVFDFKRTRVTFDAAGTSIQEISAEAHVLSEGGVKALAILKLPYTTSSQALDVDLFKVTKPDGTVITTPEYNIQDLPAEVSRTAPMYSDLHEKHILVKGLGTGDVLDYAYRLRTVKPDFPGHFWFAYSPSETDATREETLEVRVPSATGVKVDSPAWRPTVATQGGYRVYTWKQVVEHPEAKAPVRRMELLPPTVQLSNFQSWEEVGRWFQELQRPCLTLTPGLKAKAAELVRGKATDEARIRAIYDYVALKFHYISISFGQGRYQPHAADEVLENGYGDCKDKHCLLTALLRAAGFDAWPVLMGLGSHLDPALPTPGAFNHVFTVVPAGKDLLWMDSTQEAAPMGFLNFFERDREGLVAPTEAPASLRRVPVDPAFASSLVAVTHGVYAPDGTFTGTTEQRCTGDYDLGLRSFFRACPPSQWKDVLKANTSMPGASWEVEKLEPSPIEATAEPFHFSYQVTVRSALGENPSCVVVPPLPRVESLQLPAEGAPVPLALGFPGELRLRAELTLPMGWTPVLPEPVKLSCPFADFSAKAEMKDGLLIIEKVLTSKVPEVPAKDMDVFRVFLSGVRRDSTAFQAFSGKGAAMGRPSEAGAAGDRALHERHAFESLDQGRKVEAIHEFQTLVALDPEQVKFRFGLAVAYAMNHQAKESLEAGKYMLLLAPQAAQPAELLAEALLEGHHHPEARDLMVVALQTMPGTPKLRLLRGCALVGAGQGAEGLEDLKASLAGNPDLETLNLAAYALAEAGVSLDVALDWAQRAVQLIEADCGGLTTLDRGAQAKLGLLAGVWDTLGWVQYQRGDLAAAERFLEAAWLLDVRATVGDHLAQTFQKQGRMADAEATLLMAAACPRADLDLIGGHHLALTGKPLPGSRRGGEAQLAKLRSFPLPFKPKGSGFAQFEVRLSPKGLEAAKFVYGYVALQADADRLKKVDFHKLFPDDGPERILARGLLACGPKASTFTLSTLEDALRTSTPPEGKAKAAHGRPSP